MTYTIFHMFMVLFISSSTITLDVVVIELLLNQHKRFTKTYPCQCKQSLLGSVLGQVQRNDLPVWNFIIHNSMLA